MVIREEEDYSTSLRMTRDQGEALARQASLLRISKSALARLVLFWARDSGEYTPYSVEVDGDRWDEPDKKSLPVNLYLTKSLNYYLNTISVINERTKGNMLMNMLESWLGWHPYYDEEVE